MKRKKKMNRLKRRNNRPYKRNRRTKLKNEAGFIDDYMNIMMNSCKKYISSSNFVEFYELNSLLF